MTTRWTEMFYASAGCVLVLLVLASCGGGGSEPAVCGDLVCAADETAATCAEDCGCGNGVLNIGEDCDGSDLGTASCESEVARGGSLACNADCTFDVTGCDEYMCGNGIAEPGEECDGTDLGAASCAGIGFSGGQLACSASCRLDVAGCCNDFCDQAGVAACVGDTVQSCVMQPHGCLGVEITDCAASGDVCTSEGATATCICVDRCASAGQGRCTGALAETCEVQGDGCLDWTTSANCAVTGEACTVGPVGATCVPLASGESCADPFPLHEGTNVIPWDAILTEHLTNQPSCMATAMTGPDVVLAYTATVDGLVTFTLSKSAGHRHIVVVASEPCGTIPTSNELSCATNEAWDEISDGFPVTAGATYHFYVRDTVAGTAPLPDPLVLEVVETSCTGFTNPPTALSPAPGSSLDSLSTTLSIELTHQIDPNVGVITLTGDKGTTLSYDLATSPPQVTITNFDKTILIDPGIMFQPGETITVSWTGIVDDNCGVAVTAPAWTFSVIEPPCFPGADGMVGTTMSRIATDISSLTENYVAVDASPTGFVYVGGTSALYRLPKAGGPSQNITGTTPVTSTHLGYDIEIVGNQVFSLDTITGATNPFLYRLSSNDGVTWNPIGVGQYPTVAGASGYSMVHHDGTLYVAGNESTVAAGTEIWSVDTSGILLPNLAVLEGTLAGRVNCDTIAADDNFFYLGCDNPDQLIRVDRTTFAFEVLSESFTFGTTKNEVIAHDLDADGSADVLYVKGENEVVHYVCAPAGPGPYWHDVLASFGSDTTTGNFGLALDPVARVLWAWDDDTLELIKIE